LIPKTIKTWVNKTLDESESEWSILVFKLNGGVLDDSGRYRQLVNDLSFQRFLKSIDWTVTTTKRKLSNKNLKFIPFVGGDKESGISIHVHAFVEIPESHSIYEVMDLLQIHWKKYCKKLFKEFHQAEIWYQKLDKTRSSNHLRYVTRNEGKSFNYGDEKILIECKSCFLG
jgi:hypothetical protein